MNSDNSAGNLILLKNWLEKNASSDDIRYFILNEGGYMLFNLLSSLEIHNRKNLNF